MKVAIIGAGIGGLSLAYYLRKQSRDIDIDVYEKSSAPGGLGGWIDTKDYAIEPYYHHFFTGDRELISLIRELGLEDKLLFAKSLNGSFYDDGIVSMSSPFDLLSFNKLSLIERIRLAIVLVFLKLLPDGRLLDNQTAADWMKRWAGQREYEKIWDPLMKGKFDKFANKISMSWLWGRIHDRTAELGYLRGGMKVLFNSLSKTLIKRNIGIIYGNEITSIKVKENGYVLRVGQKEYLYDLIVNTTTSNLFARLIGPNQRLSNYVSRLNKISHIGVVCHLITLKKKLQNNYWVNLCSSRTPYLALIEHTNFMPTDWYKGRHLVYLTKYCSSDSNFYKSADKGVSTIEKTFKLINPKIRWSDVLEINTFKAPYCQTIFQKNYNSRKPSFRTPLPFFYLMNIDQTFPHDRNLGHGVVMAKKLSKLIIGDLYKNIS